MTELEQIDAAIAALREGRRVVRVTINGKTIEYQQATMDDLLKLRQSYVKPAGFKVGRFSGGKGL